MPGAKSFLGYDPSGSMLFDLDGSGTPVALPPSGPLALEAARLQSAAGLDPATALLPPRRGAMGADALALNDPGGMGGFDTMGQRPAAPAQRADFAPPTAAFFGGPAGPAPVAPAAPMQVGPRMTPLPTEQQAAATAGTGGMTSVSSPAAPPPAAGPEGPRKLVPTPGAGGGAAAPGGPRNPLSATAQETTNLYDAAIQAELRKRPGAATVIKGGQKVQSGEQVQAALGADPELMGELNQTDRLLGVYKGQLAAIDEKAQAYGANAAAAAEEKAATARALIDQAEREETGRILDDQKALTAEIRAARVDPSRWWSSQSKADHAMIGIGAAIADIARGFNGTGEKPNAILQQVFTQSDKDVEAQVRDIDKKRGDLNDLQRLYVQTRDRFGSDKAALEATKAAALTGISAQMKSMIAQGQIDAGVDVVPGPDGEPLLTGRFSMADRITQLQAKKAIDERNAQASAATRGTVSKAFGFTQDRVIGGGGGPSLDKVLKLQREKLEVESEQRKLGVTETGASHKNAAPVVVAGGEVRQVAPGIADSTINEAQKRLTMGQKALATADALEARGGQAGGAVGGLATLARVVGADRFAALLADPAQGFAAGQVAGFLANMSGNGVASDHQIQLAEDATTPGPRQKPALEEIRREVRNSMQVDLQSLGAAK